MNQDWKGVFRQNITQFSKLFSFLELSESTIKLIDTNPRFILNLPKRLAEKMAKDDPRDPLFLQFVPLLKEKERSVGFVEDPVADHLFVRQSKLLHKYEGRALVVTTGACAMNCRFCFRQNFPYDREAQGFAKELLTLQNDHTIQEVILSGGDPLSLPDHTLQALLEEIDRIPHVKRVRFHTRFPLGIPERIDESFLSILQGVSKQIWFILHSNHPYEYDDDVWAALKRVQRLGIPVLNQSVLLKGVNDTRETLHILFSNLVDHGIMPYYLHQLDKVEGAAHFEVPIADGQCLIEKLTDSLSGYAVPKYVQEIAGKPSKTALN